MRKTIKEYFFTNENKMILNENILLLHDFILLNTLKSETIFKIGMPELLFRSHIIKQTSWENLAKEFVKFYHWKCNRKFFLENKHIKNDLSYITEDLMRTGIYFNSIYFRTFYSISLLKELSKEVKNLVYVCDPITYAHSKSILGGIKHNFKE